MEKLNKIQSFQQYKDMDGDNVRDSTIPYDENNMDEIIPGVWLGNYRAAYNKKELDKNNIKYIINITDSIDSPFEQDKKYMIIPIHDKNVCEIKSKEFMMKSIVDSINFIDEALNNNYSILVHCRKGHHRSANLILFYLVYKYNIGYIPAIIYINNIRKYALMRNTCINKWGIEIYKLIVNYKNRLI